MVNKTKIMKITHEDITVELNKLHFDPVNPRGEPEPDEEKIRALFGAQDETAVLAAHIAENGQNPLDRLGIVKHPRLPSHYVIREGNRRLCAMQLLRDPERAPTITTRMVFRKLANTGLSMPQKVQAVLFHETIEARVWMSVKHEGPQGGLGTIAWGSAQKARFNREGDTGATRPKNPNRQAEALLTYAVNRGLITTQERARIAITTITRYLPNVRAALALINTEDCTTNAEQPEFNSALKQFLNDAIEPESGVTAEVHSRSTATQRNAYAEALRSRGVAPTTRDLPAYDPATTSAAKLPTKNPKTRNAIDPSKRKQLVLSSFVVPIKDPVLQRLVKEGKELNPDDARFSCNYLNRIILERVVHLYAKKHGVGGQGDFSEVVQRLITHSKTSSNPPSKGIVNVLTKTADKKSAYSYEIMSNAVHGGLIPSGADNRTNWETLQPVIEYLLSHLK
jgi:hypothetical protein